VSGCGAAVFASAPGSADPDVRALPRLHLVTDDAVLESSRFLARAAEALEAGGPRVALHVRGPRSSGRMVYEAAAALLPAARHAGATLVVSDRIDVALATAAHGVHLGARSFRTADARALLGAHALIGCSLAARPTGCGEFAGTADYLLVGTIYASASHPGRPPVGLDALRAAVRRAGRPVIAIGGVVPARVAELLGAGAHGAAVLRAVWDAPDPAAAVDALSQELYRDER
jgi:thiamine-phosphate pyrophosphorylase